MTEEGQMGRPPKKAHLKKTKRMVLLFTPSEREELDAIIASEGYEGDNDFGREAIREKIERIESNKQSNNSSDD